MEYTFLSIDCLKSNLLVHYKNFSRIFLSLFLSTPAYIIARSALKFANTYWDNMYNRIYVQNVHKQCQDLSNTRWLLR